jgi:hypothetical protein
MNGVKWKQSHRCRFGARFRDVHPLKLGRYLVKLRAFCQKIMRNAISICNVRFVIENIEIIFEVPYDGATSRRGFLKGPIIVGEDLIGRQSYDADAESGSNRQALGPSSVRRLQGANAKAQHSCQDREVHLVVGLGLPPPYRGPAFVKFLRQPL